MSDNNDNGNNKTLKALIALAGFAFGATTVVAWNNRKTIQNKVLDVKERAFDLKQKTIQLTDASKQKLSELRKIEVNFKDGFKLNETSSEEINTLDDENSPTTFDDKDLDK